MKGSLTIYFALTFTVMVSLITGCIYSAKVEAGRSRTANAADQAVFSLFANYDQSLFDQYQIFMIDGSCGTDHLSTLSICNYLSENADYILHPKKDHFLSRGSSILTLEETNCALTGYTLATDMDGIPFRVQAVEAEKDTLGLSGGGSSSGRGNTASSFPESSVTESSSLEDSAEVSFDSSQSFTDYPSEEASSADSESASAEGSLEVPADFVNPLPILEALRQSSLLPLVIDETSHSVSDKVLPSEAGALLSERNQEKGFGILNSEGASFSASDRILFLKYLMDHFSCFTDVSNGESSGSGSASALDYGLEYLVSGKKSDRKNLEKTAKKLLLRREAVNYAFLQTDSIKHSEISEEVLLIASAIGIPAAEPILQSLFSLAWAFAESLVDVHALFDGKHTPAVKTSASWQVEIADLPELAANLTSLEKDASGGLSYRDYLNLFLAGKSTSSLTRRAMDLIELNMRASGNPGFQFDRCIDSLSFELSVTSERKIPLTASASYSYRESS